MQLMKGVEGAPRAELCLEASANLPVGGPGEGRGCRNEMGTGNEAKQKRSSRGPREAPHAHQSSPACERVECSKEFFPVFETPTKWRSSISRSEFSTSAVFFLFVPEKG